MAKILVTGCAGFVGSWICDKIIANGDDIVGIDNLASKVNYTPDKVQFHKMDINSDISDLIKGIDAVVHTASYAELRHNWDDVSERKRIFINNETATLNLLEQIPAVPIIYLSSASVYGSLSQHKKTTLREEDANPGAIESPYAAAKFACEAYVATWSYKRDVPWYNLRLVNQVGPRIHRGVLVDFCKMATDNHHIHAADNGIQKKNWVAVEDTADIVVRLLNDKNRVPSGIYTVTSTERWSWWDIIAIMKEMYTEKYPQSMDPFSLTFEDRMAGAIGDPVNLNLSNEKLSPYYICKRPVKNYIKYALAYLNWAQ
jgi:nucleoside-diphosphate-sugar epimerase